MKISVITVCFNSEETIEDTIKSVLSQSYKNIEYIIIDGGSTDGTLSIIEKYRAFIDCFISEPDDGLYDAMNKGINHATGEVIGILNSDDIFQDSSVISLIASNLNDQEVDGCYADLVYVQQHDLTKVVRLWKSCEYHDDLWSTGWAPAHPTFFAKSNLYTQYGLFDVSNRLAADYELLIRIIGKGKINIKYIPEVLVRMRLGGETNKSIVNIIKQNIEIFRAAKRNGFNFSMVKFIFSKLKIKMKEFNSASLLHKGEND
ncbi:glycosyltransferase family 2 protein [Endozoicomonas arenosclerae]|uniref:glycosyltransferase family 2 protein n=1 Tax=Endozoicomonas arenosclerae TaxID=1633495 RepID=UPI0007820555|nr:glycosyltransferase family 2 protein [Endozoicomonas arenosclerae]